MTDPTLPPDPIATVVPPKTREHGRLPLGVVLTAIAALTVAVITWISTSREVTDLQEQVTSMRTDYQQLALQVTGRKTGAAPVGQIIDVANAQARGNADAVVTLIEFSDYECPFCIRHFQTTMPQLDEHYIKTGKIRYVFRDFPIDVNHPQAIRAHEAARCAVEQNKFWDLHPRLFSAPGTHTPPALEALAKTAGLDESAFRACIAKGATTAGIRASSSVADAMGATGTPWFFVGLRDLKTNQVKVTAPIAGAMPYSQFVLALDAALGQAGK